MFNKAPILAKVNTEEFSDCTVDEGDAFYKPCLFTTLRFVQNRMMDGFSNGRVQSREAVSMKFRYCKETPNKVSGHDVGLSSGAIE